MPGPWSDLSDSGPLLLRLGSIAVLLASLALCWLSIRSRRAGSGAWLSSLTVLAAFLTFDLIAFGAFTRLSDSGLGCPDWPGCYGEASPMAAHRSIALAEQAMPTGPVTQEKAWIEMLHRYLAMAVGALILVMAVLHWLWRQRVNISPWWASVTLAWVVVQGLFGRYTVTLKLYPAIVTLHLAGAMVLLGLLVGQSQLGRERLPVSRAWIPGLVRVALLMLSLQIVLGGWVSTNYAVLACQGFPLCNGQWWPEMDLLQGFQVQRELGRSADGQFLSQNALVGIHWMHRLSAIVVALVLAFLARCLWTEPHAELRRLGAALAGLLLLQWATGVGNVVLQWPLLGALAHTSGAAALVALLVALWVRVAHSSQAPPLASPAFQP